MRHENKPIMASILNIEVLVSFAMVIGVLIDFKNRISGHLAVSEDVGISRYAYFMVAITFMSILILFINGIQNKGASFIWLAVFYVVVAFISTVLSGLYPVQRLPFRFVELFYWVAVMLLSYYSVLSLNTTKFHVAIVVLMLPVLSYSFFIMRGIEMATSDKLLLNPVFYISFLMPIVLLLRSKILKVGGLLLIFVVVVLSYKRMVILAYSMSILVYFYYLSFSGSNVKSWRIVTVFLGAIMFIGILAYSFRYLAGAFGLDWTGRMSDLFENGGGGRLGIWGSIPSALAEQDFLYWLYGHGYRALATDIRYAHNDAIEILYDFGLMGLVLYLMFVGKIIRTFFEMKRFKYRHFGAFAVSLVWAAGGGMTDVFINYPYHFLGIALFWGITIADFENAKKQEYLTEMDDLYAYQYDDEDAVLFYE